MRRFVALCVLAWGCTLDQSGLLDDTGGPDVGPSDAAAEATNDAAVDATADVVIEAGEAGEAGDDGGCDPSSCAGERCEGGACAFYATCLEMHATDPARPTGMHMFYNQVSYEAWCDMDDQGGGWTLVGRTSLGQQSTTFGWASDSQSDPQNLATPYSLGAVGKNLTFTEALAGTRGTGLTFDVDVYHVALPTNFPSGYATASTTSTVATIASFNNTCINGNTPTMFTHVGFTSQNTYFFFRDINGTAGGNYGLLPGAWDTYYSDCRGGLMKGLDGILMAR